MPIKDPFQQDIEEPDASSPHEVENPSMDPPTPEDLRYSMLKAQKDIGRPIILSWKNPQKENTYLLTVTLATGAREPTWILHVGDEENSAVVWIYTTSDTQLISRMITGGKQDSPIVLPPSRRPTVSRVTEERPKPTKDSTSKISLNIAQDDDSAPLPQAEFDGKYELLSRLGHGGMGVIFKAKRVSDNELVAVKVLHSHLLNDIESKKRFEQEASSAKALTHRNLIAVHEFGFSKHGQPYMTMEYLEGSSLASILDNEKKLEIRTFIKLFTQICDGLQHAHVKGVVHRDVKPSNVMVVRSDSGVDIVKVLDFGIAKRLMEKNNEDLTPTGNVLGSPSYIAPEQCAGAEADPRSDIYSLGCVMYEAVTGQPPFVHESAIKILLMQLGDPPPPFSVTCPELNLPRELETIILRCLEKDPAARYQSAAELSTDLWTFNATGQRGLIPEPVAEQKEPILAKEAASSLAQLAKFEPGANLHASSNETKKRAITFRFRRFRGPSDLDFVYEGLSLARNIQRREGAGQISIFLDMESACVIQSIDLVSSRLMLDHHANKKFAAIQSLLRDLIKGGAVILASERWSKQWSESKLPGVMLMSEDDIANLILERTGSILDY